MPNSTCLYPPQRLSLNKAISFPQYLIFSFLEIGYYRLRARPRKAENTHKPIWNSGFQKSGTRTVVRYKGHERLIIWLQALSSPWISRAGAGRFRRAWQRQEKPMERQSLAHSTSTFGSVKYGWNMALGTPYGISRDLSSQSYLVQRHVCTKVNVLGVCHVTISCITTINIPRRHCLIFICQTVSD